MLDFSVYSDVERKEYVEKELDKKAKFSNSELETMANYILYGKDKNGQNAVDRGEVQIETKYKSYTRKKEGSLDELIESPTFNEETLKPVKRSIYKNPKPTLRKNLPQLQPLLIEIARVEEEYKTKSEDPNYSSTDLYKLKHFLIELKKQQYIIQESVLGESKNTSVPQHYTFPELGEDLGVDCKPLGLKIGYTTRFDNPREDKSNFEIPTNPNSLDFENPAHIYSLVESYSLLKETSTGDPFNNTSYVLETLEFYEEFAELSEVRAAILKGKKYKMQNSEIAKLLRDKFNISYNENYISTIYKNEICKKIAEAASLHRSYWENRNNSAMWKKCSCCGKYKLKTPNEFVRKRASSDGLSSRCKVCEHQKRKESKTKKEAI